MAERSGFFNALNTGGEYDRTYNANDYTENLAVVVGSGVLRSENNDLKVTSNGDMTLNVNAGRGWINGHWYINDSVKTLNVPTAPSGGARYDRVMLRLDNTLSRRVVSITYIEGEASNAPVKPAPVRTDDIYDLVLADIYITANAVAVGVTDTRADAEICGWVYSTSGDNSFFTALDTAFYEWFTNVKDDLSSVTLFKRYKWRTVTQTATQSVQFDIPQFDEETCFIEVYVNGILDTEGVEYSRSGNVLTGLGLPLVAGTEIEVNCYKSIDGTGIMSVSDEITELQNSVAALEGISRYTYDCTGLNDNISLSQIAEAITSGDYDPDDLTPAALAFMTEFGDPSELAQNARVTIDVCGKFGATTPFAGDGSSATPYKWIKTDVSNNNVNVDLIFDFGKCEIINFECSANTNNSVFYGNRININNAKVIIAETNNNVAITALECLNNTFNGVNVNNSTIIIQTTGAARIAEHGTFTDCYCEVVSEIAAAYCFKPKSAGLIRLIGGTYLAYGATSSGIGSAISHTSAGDTDAVLMAFNIHAPISVRTGYSQGYLSVANAGNTYINGVVSRLTSSGAYNEIVGQINRNKA